MLESFKFGAHEAFGYYLVCLRVLGLKNGLCALLWRLEEYLLGGVLEGRCEIGKMPGVIKSVF